LKNFEAIEAIEVAKEKVGPEPMAFQVNWEIKKIGET